MILRGKYYDNHSQNKFIQDRDAENNMLLWCPYKQTPTLFYFLLAFRYLSLDFLNNFCHWYLKCNFCNIRTRFHSLILTSKDCTILSINAEKLYTTNDNLQMMYEYQNRIAKHPVQVWCRYTRRQRAHVSPRRRRLTWKSIRSLSESSLIKQSWCGTKTE